MLRLDCPARFHQLAVAAEVGKEEAAGDTLAGRSGWAIHGPRIMQAQRARSSRCSRYGFDDGPSADGKRTVRVAWVRGMRPVVRMARRPKTPTAPATPIQTTQAPGWPTMSAITPVSTPPTIETMSPIIPPEVVSP